MMDHVAARRLDGVLSGLFVPAGNTRLLVSACAKKIASVVVDLEDAIPVEAKDTARAGLAADVATLRAGVGMIAVRINRPWRMMIRDIEAAVAAGADIIMVPKIEAASDVAIVSEILDEISPEGKQVIISQIESAVGLLAMPQIARARPDRHAALMLGPEDLALDLRTDSSRDVMTPHAQALVLAARSGGLHAIGSPGSIAEINDMAAYQSQIEAGKKMGFDAVIAIHPKQISVIEEIYRTSTAEIAEAHAIVEGDRQNAGRPFMLNGKMVDAPVVARARRVLRTAQLHG
ncbi:CoA ester lyase (plasmid) [Pseudorhodobacter turbinis]|uniref:CoA ester lyase n=1 Tax=Pseudorhodobacter turbinis TaxID=2500533 RepID=A0A4P8EL21_9RHOB|nr:CoA ester lyase [Pseudorhodobacter turbinis]QCO57756.1 CoA ester lyase [Pseudorhodobacter turbinis]